MVVQRQIYTTGKSERGSEISQSVQKERNDLVSHSQLAHLLLQLFKAFLHLRRMNQHP